VKKISASVLLRIVIIALLVIVQISVLMVGSVIFSGKSIYFNIICTLISIVATIIIVRRDSNPEYKIAWIIPILLFPVFGGLFYLLFGRIRPTRRERKHGEMVAFRHDQAIMAQPYAQNAALALEKLKNANTHSGLRATYLERTAFAPLYENTATQYFSLGDDMYPKMLDDLESAEKSIYLEYFIIRPGIMWSSILDILTRKAAEGVDVRLMYDDFGCMLILPYDYPQEMEELGIKCCVFNRLSNVFSARFNNRDHRKMCIIDGNIGYTGGINIADEYINKQERFGHWKDTAIRLEGEAVWSMTMMFLSFWGSTTGNDEDYIVNTPTMKGGNDGFVQPFNGVPLDDDSVSEVIVKQILGKAERYVYITTPYLIIGSGLITALIETAQTGVDVRIITPAIPDKKIVFWLTQSYYEVLIKNGVKIYEYTPGFMHSKTIVSDDENAVVGTINLDFRSMYLHFECAVMLYGTQSVGDVYKDFVQTQALCEEVSLSKMKKLPLLKRLFISLLRIFSPLM